MHTYRQLHTYIHTYIHKITCYFSILANKYENVSEKCSKIVKFSSTILIESG